MTKPPPKSEPAAFRLGRRLIAALLLGGAGAVWLGTGVYFVQPNERAVVRCWGRIVEPNGLPGLGWCWPWPIGRVDRPRTTDVNRVVIGLNAETRGAIAAGDVLARSKSPGSDVLTGDVNIVKVGLIAQYQIREPDRYLTGAAEPERLVRLAVHSVLIRTLGELAVDYALTEGKTELQNRCRNAAQGLLDAYASGISLVAVNLEGIEPPNAIIDAFQDVSSAKKDREKTIDQATAFANALRPKARGRAAELVAAAEGYRAQRVNRAEGEAQRFRSVYAEYVKAPWVTRARLRLQTVGDVLRRARLYVISPNAAGPPLRVTLYDRNAAAGPKPREPEARGTGK